MREGREDEVGRRDEVEERWRRREADMSVVRRWGGGGGGVIRNVRRSSTV